MSKVILFNMVTVDGYIAGPGGDITWHRVDEEFNDFAAKQLDAAAGLIFGRITYEMMASYWPTPAALTDDPIIAGKMNAVPKLVFSRTLEGAGWENTRLVQTDAATELARVKAQPGKDWLIFGSADLAATFTQHGLIDEYRLIINPVVLGRGQPLFKDVQNPLKLQFLKTRTFGNGNVLLCYGPSAGSE
jgi:dihydrofolate reductase